MLGLPTTFWFLWSGVLVNRVGSFVLIFLTLYLTGERGMSPTVAGAVVSLYGLGAMAAGPIGGVIADRIGRRITLLAATVFGGMAMLQLGFARGSTHIAVSTLVLGFFSELFRPAANAAVVDIVPEPARVRAFGYLYWAANLGFAAAALLGGLLVHVGYVWLFVFDAATTFAFGLLVAFTVPESRPVPHPEARSEYLRPYRDRRLLRFLVAQFLVALVFMQFSSTLSYDMRRQGLADVYGYAISINGVMIVVLQPLSIALFARASRKLVLALGTLLVGLGFGLMPLGHSTAWYVTTIAIWTLGEIVFTPVTPAVIGDLAPPHLRGSYQGALHLSFSVAFAVAPLAGMAAIDRFGSAALWLGCLASCTVSSLIHLTSGGYETRDLAARSDQSAA